MKLTFHADELAADVRSLGAKMKDGADRAMRKVVAEAAKDARALASWRSPGDQIQTYGDTVWEWETTGLAARSIQGYLVGEKNLAQFADQTISRRNGTPLRHPHRTDDSVTGDHSPVEGRSIGILTMNINYAVPLQDWEEENGGLVVEEVFAANWDINYVRTIIEPELNATFADTSV